MSLHASARRHPDGSEGRGSDVERVALAHGTEAFLGVGVELGQAISEERDQGAEGLAPHHPLEVGTVTVPVGTVQAAAWDQDDEPLEEPLVPDVHAERDLRLTPVATEGPFADQDTEEKSLVKRGECQIHAPHATTLFHVELDGETRGVVSPSRFTWNLRVLARAFLVQQDGVARTSWATLSERAS